jgi:hypothetical protein
MKFFKHIKHNKEHGILNTNQKRGTRNAERETRNAERETRNAERETRNAEPGTRNAERTDYRQHLIRPLSLHYIDHLVKEVISSPADFETVYRLIFDSDEKVAWRAAWACQKISEKHPEWFIEKQFIEMANLIVSNSHGGLQRGCLSVLNNLPVPESLPVGFINACFERIYHPSTPISVQCLSMKILYRICLMEPGFIPELKAYLENIDATAYSAGFNSTRTHILKALKNK